MGAVAALGAGQGGARPRGAGLTLRARRRGVGQRPILRGADRAEIQRSRCRGRKTAALRSGPRAQALQGAVRAGGGSDRGKQLLLGAIGRAHATAIPGAGDGGAQGRRAACMAHPRSCADGASGCLLAQGAAAACAHPQGGEAHDWLRQSAARRAGRREEEPAGKRAGKRARHKQPAREKAAAVRALRGGVPHFNAGRAG